MRARGRLSREDFEFDRKHPILLPSKHSRTQLVILKCHLDNYHQGVECMRHELQQRFWILGLRNALRSIKSRCVPCRKYNASVQAPLMADSPREKVEKVDFLFTYVGVDYFGGTVHVKNHQMICLCFHQFVLYYSATLSPRKGFFTR